MDYSESYSDHYPGRSVESRVKPLRSLQDMLWIFWVQILLVIAYSVLLIINFGWKIKIWFIEKIMREDHEYSTRRES
jgi:hypothetical protein